MKDQNIIEAMGKGRTLDNDPNHPIFGPRYKVMFYEGDTKIDEQWHAEIPRKVRDQHGRVFFLSGILEDGTGAIMERHS